ncbi:MAG: PAS domain S-box protein [Acidimicrobiia bacterium]
MSSVLIARNERYRLMGLLLRVRMLAYAIIGIPGIIALDLDAPIQVAAVIALAVCAGAPFIVRRGGRYSGVRLSGGIDVVLSYFVWVAVPDAAAITLVLSIWTVAVVEFFSRRSTSTRFAGTVMAMEISKIGLVLIAPTSVMADQGLSILLIAGRTIAIGLSFLVMRGLDRYLQSLHAAAETSADRYQRLLASAPTAFLVVTDGVIRYANDAAQRLLTGGIATIHERSFGDFADVTSRDGLLESIDRCEQRLEPFTLVGVAMVNETGETIVVDAAVTPIDYGNELAVQVALHDVSAQRRAESELIETRLNFRSFFERIPVALYRSRPNGEIIQANRALVDLLGARSEAELIGMDAGSMYVDSVDRQRLNEMLAEQRTVVGFEARMRRLDGTVIWVRDTTRMIDTDVGEIYEGALVDVTGRRNIEDELWARAIQQEAAASIGQIALEADDISLVMRSVTESVARVLRTDGAAVLARQPDGSFNLLGHTSSFDLDPLATASLADRAHMTAAPVVLRSAVEVRFAAPRLADANVESVVAVMIPGADIDFGTLFVLSRTERIFTSEDLNFLHSVANVLAAAIDRASAKARLETLLRSKDAFVASVSHELRTPLTVVNGMALELNERWAELTQEECGEFTRMLVEQSQDMSDLIEDLLVAARANVGSVTVVSEPVEIDRHIRSVLASYPADPGRTIRVDVHEGIVDADPMRVRQILRNLITNAIRYGGPNIEVMMASTSGAHAVEVIDDGPGIPAEDRDRVFEPYERAHTAIGLPGSVGLGLTVSRTLAELMGGSLTYRHDGRSCFRLELSRDTDAERARASELEKDRNLVIPRTSAFGVGRIGVDLG